MCAKQTQMASKNKKRSAHLHKKQEQLDYINNTSNPYDLPVNTKFIKDLDADDLYEDFETAPDKEGESFGDMDEEEQNKLVEIMEEKCREREAKVLNAPEYQKKKEIVTVAADHYHDKINVPENWHLSPPKNETWDPLRYINKIIYFERLGTYRDMENFLRPKLIGENTFTFHIGPFLDSLLTVGRLKCRFIQRKKQKVLIGVALDEKDIFFTCIVGKVIETANPSLTCDAAMDYLFGDSYMVIMKDFMYKVKDPETKEEFEKKRHCLNTLKVQYAHDFYYTCHCARMNKVLIS